MERQKSERTTPAQGSGFQALLRLRPVAATLPPDLDRTRNGILISELDPHHLQKDLRPRRRTD